LEGLEFEVDVAGRVSWRVEEGERVEGTLYQPASRERAAERMQGVSTQGFWVGAVFEPIALVVDVGSGSGVDG
jgi:hypothetical protein